MPICIGIKTKVLLLTGLFAGIAAVTTGAVKRLGGMFERGVKRWTLCTEGVSKGKLACQSGNSIMRDV